jgi:hypothetical protein
MPANSVTNVNHHQVLKADWKMVFWDYANSLLQNMVLLSKEKDKAQLSSAELQHEKEISSICKAR